MCDNKTALASFLESLGAWLGELMMGTTSRVISSVISPPFLLAGGMLGVQSSLSLREMSLVPLHQYLFATAAAASRSPCYRSDPPAAARGVSPLPPRSPQPVEWATRLCV